MTNSTGEQVLLAYRLILGRDPDPDGFAKYTADLENGDDLNILCLSILDSEEARKRNLMIVPKAASIYRATGGGITQHPRWREIIQQVIDQELRETSGRGMVIEAVDGSALLTVSHLTETMITGFFHIFDAPTRSMHVSVLRNGSNVAEASCEVARVLNSDFGPVYAQLRFTGLTTSRVDWLDGEFEILLSDEINTWRFSRSPLKCAEPEVVHAAEPVLEDAPAEVASEAPDHLAELLPFLRELDRDTLQMVAEIVAIVTHYRR